MIRGLHSGKMIFMARTKKCHAVFLLGIYLILLNFCSVFSGSDDCPPPENVSPCTCSVRSGVAELECVGMQDHEELNQVANKSTDWKFPTFIIRNSSFMYIPTNVLVQKKVVDLQVYDSVLASLFEKPVPATSKFDRILLQSSIFTSGLKWEHLSKMLNLREFIFNYGEVKKIDQTFIDNMPRSLEGLQLNDTKTTKLDPHAFVNLPNLKSLYLAFNNIKFIKRSMFPEEPKLNAFQIKFCNLRYLPDDIFSNMPNLRHIDLGGTNIVVIEASVFRSILPQLRWFNLRGNDINCNCKMEWMTSVTKPTHTDITCQKPKALKGLSINDLTSRHFSHC